MSIPVRSVCICVKNRKGIGIRGSLTRRSPPLAAGVFLMYVKKFLEFPLDKNALILYILYIHNIAYPWENYR